jgi:hypothetical protein
MADVLFFVYCSLIFSCYFMYVLFFIFAIFLRPFMFLVFSFLSFQFQDKLSIIKISSLTNADIVNLMHPKTNRKHYYYSISKTLFPQLLIKYNKMNCNKVIKKQKRFNSLKITGFMLKKFYSIKKPFNEITFFV